MKGSRNVTVALVLLAYYVLQSYVPLLRRLYFPGLQYWQVTAAYCLLAGALFRNRSFLAAACTTLAAFAAVMAILLYRRFSLSAAQMALSHRGLPLYMFLFVVLPAMFFSLTFDPFRLVKDLPALGGARAPAYLLLLLCSGEMLKARLAELVEHLQARGLDLGGHAMRLRYAHLLFPPLLRASIQEAAYRHSYAAMLGCPPDRFPLRRRQNGVSAWQKGALIGIVLLAVLRAAYELVSVAAG